MQSLFPYATALILGSVHALEADHMAAVTSFAVRRPAPLAAAGFGLRWALGHGSSLLVAGLALLLAGLAIPDGLTFWLDRSVGGVLIGLGFWSLYSAVRMHAHVHRHEGGVEHAHLHSHLLGEEHEHRIAPTLIGALHGLAGAAPALALLEISGGNSTLHGLYAIVVFAIGTALGMAAYAMLAGYVAGRAALASARIARVVSGGTGIITIAIGVAWLTR
jgi:ABC-type nickel/cobalt efflux system permease component RcnA